MMTPEDLVLLESAICSAIQEDYENGLTVLVNCKASTYLYLSKLKENIGDYIIPEEDFILPSISIPIQEDIDKVKVMIANCPFLNTDPLLKTIDGLIETSKNQITNSINNELGDQPEFILESQLNEIQRLYKGFDLETVVPRMKKALGCLDSICFQEISGKEEQLKTILENLVVTEEGKLDVDLLLFWLTDEAKLRLNNAFGVAGQIREDIENALKELCKEEE